MHTIFYAANIMNYPSYESSVDDSSMAQKDLKLAVKVNEGNVVDVVQGGRRQRKDRVPFIDGGYSSFFDDQFILDGDGTLYRQVQDLNDSETSSFLELKLIKSYTKSEQDKRDHRERIKGILDDKYKKVNPGTAIDPSFTVPFDAQEDYFRIGSDCSDMNHEIGGNTSLDNGVMKFPAEGKILEFHVYQS